ncbi:protein ALP1-like, partial [Aphis craccivora]
MAKPDFADIIVKACCILHNFVRRRDGGLGDLEEHQNDTGGRSQGKDVRDYFANNFLEAGSVPFHYRFCPKYLNAFDESTNKIVCISPHRTAVLLDPKGSATIHTVEPPRPRKYKWAN